MPQRISKKEFILWAIENLRPPDTPKDPKRDVQGTRHYGLNTKWSGFEQAFELLFGEPSCETLKALAREGIILIKDNRARRGGVVIYNAKYLPRGMKKDSHVFEIVDKFSS